MLVLKRKVERCKSARGVFSKVSDDDDRQIFIDQATTIISRDGCSLISQPKIVDSIAAVKSSPNGCLFLIRYLSRSLSHFRTWRALHSPAGVNLVRVAVPINSCSISSFALRHLAPSQSNHHPFSPITSHLHCYHDHHHPPFYIRLWPLVSGY